MKNKLLLIDGLNYLFRAYFGVPQSATTINGTPVNAVYGFFSFLRSAIQFYTPTHLLIIFDSENAVNIKQNDFTSYKANRTYDNPEMFAQLRIIKEILRLMDIEYQEEDGIEADDLIGTYANYGTKYQCSVLISSNDFDFMQLISDNVSVIRHQKGKITLFDHLSFETQFGFSPTQYIDYAALLGDKSDNINGVKGIGKVTAKTLIKKYNSVENLIGQTTMLTGKLKILIEANAELILNNKRFMSINTQISDKIYPIDVLNFKDKKVFLKTTKFFVSLNI